MKKHIALAILLAIFCTTLLGGGVAFAATAVSMDTTDVMTDLQGSKIAGEDFNPDNFSYSDEKEPVVLSFAEFGFSYDTKSQGDYGVYVYVYNPTGKAITGNSLNKISIATVYQNGKAIDYEKFTLQYLSASTGKYAYLFYKFKVQNAKTLWTRVSRNANLRRYDVAEIELNFGKPTSEAFTVGNYYEYSGYAQGYGADPNAASTLACKTDSIETLRLEVSSSYFRYNNGDFVQSNLQSVYFGVPNETFNKYGKLQQIKANWFETKTSPQFVLNSVSHYDNLESWVGKRVNGYNETIHYEYVSPDPDFYIYSYNLKMGKSTLSQFDWLFFSNSGKVSTDEVLSYAQTYTSRFGGDLLIDKYSKALFVEEVDNGRQYGWQGDNGQGVVIDADSLFDINGFTTGSKFWDWWFSLFSHDLEHDDLKNIEPIYIVKDADILGSNSTIAERLLIDENDVDDFKAVYKQNLLAGKKTVLFRFAMTDYVSYPLYAHYYKVVDSPFKYDNIGYIAQQTAFLDFDIIWLKFAKENQSTVIPVVSSPLDVFSGLTPPLSNAGLNILAVVLAVVLFVAIVYAAYKLVCVIVKKK